mmetsp:Transcript_20872/g.52729  ORF Transcript_20872/g.52729 Transcript_20872/m.52729 type:complete len:208 (-) Transcript_20872:1810-2433(-)
MFVILLMFFFLFLTTTSKGRLFLFAVARDDASGGGVRFRFFRCARAHRFRVERLPVRLLSFETSTTALGGTGSHQCPRHQPLHARPDVLSQSRVQIVIHDLTAIVQHEPGSGEQLLCHGQRDAQVHARGVLQRVQAPPEHLCEHRRHRVDVYLLAVLAAQTEHRGVARPQLLQVLRQDEGQAAGGCSISSFEYFFLVPSGQTSSRGE